MACQSKSSLSSCFSVDAGISARCPCRYLGSMTVNEHQLLGFHFVESEIATLLHETPRSFEGSASSFCHLVQQLLRNRGESKPARVRAGL